jgi:hypothetical protein
MKIMKIIKRGHFPKSNCHNPGLFYNQSTIYEYKNGKKLARISIKSARKKKKKKKYKYCFIYSFQNIVFNVVVKAFA